MTTPCILSALELVRDYDAGYWNRRPGYDSVLHTLVHAVRSRTRELRSLVETSPRSWRSPNLLLFKSLSGMFYEHAARIANNALPEGFDSDRITIPLKTIPLDSSSGPQIELPRRAQLGDPVEAMTFMGALMDDGLLELWNIVHDLQEPRDTVPDDMTDGERLRWEDAAVKAVIGLRRCAALSGQLTVIPLPSICDAESSAYRVLMSRLEHNRRTYPRVR